MKLRLAVLILGGMVPLATIGVADAASLTILDTVVNPPAGCTSACAGNYGFASIPSGDPYYGGITTVTAAPTTYTLGNILNQNGSPVTASDFGASVYTAGSNCPGNGGSSINCLDSTPLLSWNFQDNYEFLTPNSGPKVSGAVLSFSSDALTGLANVEARIVLANTANAADLVGTSTVTIVDGWQSLTQQQIGALTLYTASLNKTPLAGNTYYYLQVRGEAASMAAGYSGTATFAPVPLPGALPLLLSGLGLLGRWTRRAGVCA